MIYILSQGSRLAVSRYPRDTRFRFWILDIIGLVSQKIEILAKFDCTSRGNDRQNNIFSLFVARKWNGPEHKVNFCLSIFCNDCLEHDNQ